MPKGNKGVPHPWRRKHLPELDRQVLELSKQGMKVADICRELGVGKTCVTDSRARLFEAGELEPRFVKPAPVYSGDLVREFELWLFDAENCHKDPCVKWIELFGDPSERWEL